MNSQSDQIKGHASMLAMFGIIFLIFFGKSELIVAKWSTVLLLQVPNALFIAITLAVVTVIDHRLGLRYGDHMAVVFAPHRLPEDGRPDPGPLPPRPPGTPTEGANRAGAPRPAHRHPRTAVRRQPRPAKETEA